MVFVVNGSAGFSAAVWLTTSFVGSELGNPKGGPI